MGKKIYIVGGGIIGLAVGWQLVRNGKNVEIYESNTAGKAASWVAAGMLAPYAESYFEGLELFELCKESLDLYPKFIDELKEDSGISLNLDKCGTLIIGFNRDDVERIQRLYNFYVQNQFPVYWLDGEEAREIEPMLSPKTIAAIWIPDEAQIDNRALIEALKIAFVKREGHIYENKLVDEIKLYNNKVVGIKVNNSFIDTSNSKVILAAGSWSKKIEGLSEEILPPVRPVKGQIISLNMNGSFKLTHIIRAPDVYLTPKSDGRLLVGASSEEKGFDLNPTAGEIMWLLRRAWEAVPYVYELSINELSVGLRPGSRDNAPIIGQSKIENLYYATGHYRHGILLTPITAYGMKELIMTNTIIDYIKPFQPSRFF
ncbi:MAG: glycine oxidase ThiO [Melioribacteraceae bacterium]